MRILLVLPDTEVGGITTAAVNLMTELAQRGHALSLLDMSGAYQCEKALPAGVTRLCLSKKESHWNIRADACRKAKGIRRLGLLFLGLLKKLTVRSGLWYDLIFNKQTALGEFDVAIAFRQGAPAYHFVLHSIAAKRKLAFVHGELAHMGDISPWKRYLPAFHRVAYVAEAVRKEFVTAYPELEANSITVCNMFDREAILSCAALSSPPFDGNDTKRIVTVARVQNFFKRIDRIVDTCRILKEKKAPPFHWYVVGDGPDLREMCALAKERDVEDVLTFVGHKENPFPFMRAADFTVLSSKSEAYPMVVMESLILGVPVLTTRFGAAEEMLREGEYGWTVEQSTEALAEKTLSLLKNENGALDRAKDTLKATVFTNDIPYHQFLNAVGEIQ